MPEPGDQPSITTPIPHRAREACTVFALYLLITLLLTWPLVTQFTTHIPGIGGDAYQFLWNTWWVKYALVDLHTSPYATHLLFHPTGVSLTYHTLSLCNALIALPFMLVSNPTIAFNIMFFLIMPLAGLSMYYLCLHLTSDRRAAFIGGILFAFSPFRMVRTEAHLNILSLHFIPFFVLFLLKSFQYTVLKWRWIFFGAAAFGATILSCWYYMIYSIIIGIFLAVSSVVSKPSAATTSRVFMRLCLILGIGIGLATPLMLPVFREFSVDPDAFYAHDSEKYSVDSMNYLLPNHLNPLLKQVAHEIAGPSGTFLGNRCEGMAAIGYCALVLAGIGAWRFRPSRQWVFLGTIGVLFSLGPTLHIAGRAFPGVPMPFSLLQHIPVVCGARVPGRFAMLVTMSIAVLGALGMSRLLNNPARSITAQRLLFGVIGFVILFEYLPIPIRTCSTHIPEALDRLRSEPSCTAIVEWPMDACQSMMRQTLHHKPIADGYISRIPAPAVLRKQAVERFLLQCAEFEKMDVFDPPASPFARFHLDGISHFVLDLAQLKRDIPDPAGRLAIIQRVRDLYASPSVAADAEVEIFRIESPDAVFETPLSGNGWSKPECSPDRCSRILNSQTGYLELAVSNDRSDLSIEITYSSVGSDLTCQMEDKAFSLPATGDLAQDRSVNMDLPGISRGTHTIRFMKPPDSSFILKQIRVVGIRGRSDS